LTRSDLVNRLGIVMPSRFAVKTFIEGGYYHIFNRGVEKRYIYEDGQDCDVFLRLLSYYLSPFDPKAPHPFSGVPDIKMARARPLSNLNKEVELLAYCLMPNHFHLLIKQGTRDGMTKLLRRTLTAYTMYFNKRNNRVGHLFQGKYKASLIPEDPSLIHISRYIHLNPTEITNAELSSYPYSSYPYYLGSKKEDWVKEDFILDLFNKSKDTPPFDKFASYKDFVEANPQDAVEAIGQMAIDAPER
jgi:putative transposase